MRFGLIKNLLKAAIAFFLFVPVLCFPSPSSAAGNAVVSVSAPAFANSGQQFTVNINVQPNNVIAGVQFNLSFNPSLVTVNSITEGNLLKQNGASTYFVAGTINNTAGTVSSTYGAITSPGQTVSAANTFACITMTAKTTEGTCPLALSSIIVGDANGQAIPTTTNNGQVVISVNHAPVLNAIGNKSVNEGATLNFAISATDPELDSLTYAASNLPSGANFSSATRTFSWTPGYTQAGTYTNVYFQVLDGNLTDSENITITVNNVNQAPVLAAIGNKTVNEGAFLSFIVTATDPDGNALTYSASNLPSGASFNTATHTFSWTPSYIQAGDYSSIHFEVSDGSSQDSENIIIGVAQPYAAWDLNNDNLINVLDMILIGQHWSESGSTGWSKNDVNDDGTINVLDMILIGQHWTG
jgi:hypothetical protein